MPLTLTTPVFLLALPPALAAVFLIHLLARRPRLQITFPTLQLLQPTAPRSHRLKDPRSLLLLILRALALSLIILAFSQPLLHRADDSQPGAHHVLVIDRSASMSRAHQGHTLLDRAVSHARSHLRNLDSEHDRASIILLDRDPRPLLPEPTANITGLISQLHDIQPTQDHADAADALPYIRQLHQRLRDEHPLHVHWVSDAQHTQWPEHAAAQLNALIADLDASFQHHTIEAPTSNYALHNPRVEPAAPLPDQPADISATLANHSSSAVTHRLTLHIDDQPVARQTLTLEPHTETRATFEHTFTNPGTHTIEFRLADPGSLTADATTGRRLHVRPHRRATLLNATNRFTPTTATRYLRHALDADDIDLRLRTLDGLHPDDTDILILVGTANLADTDDDPAALMRSIDDHLQANRAVLWFIDSSEAAAFYQRFLDANDTLSTAVQPDADEPWTDAPRDLALARFDHPVLELFQAAARTALLDAEISAGLRATATPDALVLLQLDDATPLLSLQRVNQTHLAIFAAPIAGDEPFARHPAFLPLLNELLDHLDQPPHQPNLNPGDTLQPISARWLDPAGDPLPDSTARLLGLHTCEQSHAHWVELDPRQSDLSQLPDGYFPTSTTAAQRSTVPISSTPTQPLHLWPWLTLAAFILLALEPTLASAFARPRTTVANQRTHDPAHAH